MRGEKVNDIGELWGVIGSYRGGGVRCRVMWAKVGSCRVGPETIANENKRYQQPDYQLDNRRLS